MVEISKLSWESGGKIRSSKLHTKKSNRKAMDRNWSNQKTNPALKTKTGNKVILQIDKIQ